MSTATNTIWDIRFQNGLENWYVMKIAVTEEQIEHSLEIDTSEAEIYVHEAMMRYFH